VPCKAVSFVGSNQGTWCAVVRSSRQKGRQKSLDPAVWIPRKEAARILNISLPTVLRWEGPRFRITWTLDASGRKLCFVNAEDVEHVRLERLGPKMDELERYVLAGLAAGRTPSEMVRDGHRVTLEDVQRIRDLDAQLSGAFTVQPAEASELRQLLDVDVVDGSSLVRRVREVVVRAEMLAFRLGGSAPARPDSGSGAMQVPSEGQIDDGDAAQAPPSSDKVV
jgi:hypothetical protein